MLKCTMLGAFTVTVHAVYFYNSDLIFAIKNFETESVLKVRSLMSIVRSGECGLENGV